MNDTTAQESHRKINARFWVWINDGPVKLTMRCGQVLRHYSAERTEEGYSRTLHNWEYLAHGWPAVRRSWRIDSRDCDGPMAQGGTDLCPLVLLMGHLPEAPYQNSVHGVIVRYPQWKEETRERRDTYAEAAGY